MKWDFPAVITALLALLTFLGVQKYFVEPRLIAKQLRKKYATALWISCKELQVHLRQVEEKVRSNNTNAIHALKKIPDWDFRNRADWFTKHGYYTTITAYKIAVVSSWLQIYQQELLFATYSESRAFLFALYNTVDRLKRAFSQDTCLWYDYFGAIGSRLIDRTGDVIRPISFGAFCERYYADPAFRKFYEQLHMFISFVADRRYLDKVPKINEALDSLTSFLKKENLLAGLQVERPSIDPEVQPAEQAAP